MISHETREICAIALHMVEADIDLRSVSQCGLTFVLSMKAAKEIIEVWPYAAKFIVPGQHGYLGMTVPPHESEGVVRDLVRMVMN